ncbi:hypothetical protein DID75_01820 [Candidatus Marinamargulisbacteria bacterium SCGC AG-410-N11]|nr:hypothetical protein DID75_01820 [Candidatus Marinamargulisbacteria bacterium SCGC AG-410-N11]
MQVFQNILVNLNLKKSNELSFPFLDYGFLYGYGLFESIRVINGKTFLVNEHLNRLRKGSIILDIPFVYDNDQLIESINNLIESNNKADAILNIYLTPGDRHLDPTRLKEIKDPLFLAVMRPRPKYEPSQRITLDIRQESFQKTQLDRFKTLSWMKNVLEKKLTIQEDDVLLYNQNHQILEASSANVFFVKGEKVITPKSSVVLAGITRAYLLSNQSKFDYEIVQEEVTLNDLEYFDEIFLTNALKGIILVQGLTGYQLKSKSISEKIQEKYIQIINSL